MAEKELVNNEQGNVVDGQGLSDQVPEAVEPQPMATTQKLLIRRDKKTGVVMSQQLLFDDVDTEHIIIAELPVVEERPGFTHEYVVDTQGKVTVKYTEIPKTNEQLLMESNAKLMLEVAQIKAQLQQQQAAAPNGGGQ